MFKQFREGTQPPMEYIYFNGRGRGEGVRLLMAAGGLTYKDHRVELGSTEWTEMKPNTPFGRLPVLKVGEDEIGESVAIGSYVAHRGGLAGDDAGSQTKVLSLVLQSNEFREGLARVMFLPVGEEEKAKEMEAFLTGRAAEVMGFLEKALGKNDFFHGGKLSFADIWFYHCLELLILGCKNTDFLSKWSALDALYKRVEKQPKIEEYIKNRPATVF